MSPSLLVLLVLSAVLSCSGAATLADDKLVEVGVYYEALCPDSQNFFLKQLVPVYANLGAKVFKTRLVPFGHARVLPNNKMVCQHGQAECELNRLHACIIAREHDEANLVKILGCIFAEQMEPLECSSKFLASVSQEELIRCRDGDESYKYMLDYEKATGHVGYVPQIRIDGVTSADIQDECENKLKDCVCNHYKGSKPAECGSSGAQVASNDTNGAW